MNYGSVRHLPFRSTIRRPIPRQALQDGRYLGHLRIVRCLGHTGNFLRMRNPRMSQNAIQTKLIPNGGFFELRGTLNEIIRVTLQGVREDLSLGFRQRVKSILMIRPV
jgi:hypothetical protein